MKRLLIAQICMMLLLSGTQAGAAGNDLAQISQAGDMEMSCHDISREVSKMESVIGAAEQTLNSSNAAGTGIKVAKTVGSYLVGSLGGALGIMAAGYIVGEATDDKAEDAIAARETAEQRRSFMSGVYNAKGCQGPLELATIEPAAGESYGPPYRPVRKPRYND